MEKELVPQDRPILLQNIFVYISRYWWLEEAASGWKAERDPVASYVAMLNSVARPDLTMKSELDVKSSSTPDWDQDLASSPELPDMGRVRLLEDKYYLSQPLCSFKHNLKHETSEEAGKM